MKSLLLLLFIPVLLYSQDDNQFINLSFGIEKNGYLASISYDTYLNVPSSFLRFGIQGELETYSFETHKIPVRVGIVNASIFQKLFSLDFEETNNFFIGAGLIGGYEYINKGENILDDNEKILFGNKFVYGGNASLEFHLPIFYTGYFTGGRRGILVFTAGYSYFINSDINTTQPFAKIGFKINI